MYSDPIYGGNRNMVGWKLKQFPGTPGSLGSYRERIQDEEFHEIPPQSLSHDAKEHGFGTKSGNQSSGGNQSS